jgi:hypothetical protein
MKRLIPILVILAVVLIPSVIMAQPSSGTSAPPCFPPPCIPIDGGASLLIMAGLAIGGKKAFDISRRQK